MEARLSLPDYPITVNAFEAGTLMGIICEQRVKVPRIWQQLMALASQFRAQAGVTREDLGNNMVKLTDKDGMVIIREKYDWEPI